MSAFSVLFNLLQPAEIRMVWQFCPVCLGKRPFVRLSNNEIAIRCCGCRSSVVTLAIASTITSECPELTNLQVYELSARGPLLGFLRRHSRAVTCSEYFPEIASGDYKGHVLCQDVQNLSFADQSFDLCTSTDVFEHVHDDVTGFAQVCRVLKPGGKFIFTVPLINGPTIERAVLQDDGSILHLQPPEYHGDPVSESGRILAFRNYGQDICDRLRAAGFPTARIVSPELPDFWGISRQVVVADK
jgi:SAM-dependent methyltransferase